MRKITLNIFLIMIYFSMINALKIKMSYFLILCEQLCKKGYAKQDYLEKVLKREQIAPTAYGNLFAIPHPIEKVCSRK